MDLESARKLAIQLMDKHIPFEERWFFAFDKSRTRFGNCNYTYKIISLSQYFVELNSEQDVTNTILHEIAHVLAGYDNSHNVIWRTIALSIGCDGKKCCDSQTITPKPKFIAKCSCGNVYEGNKRHTRYHCNKCLKKLHYQPNL